MEQTNRSGGCMVRSKRLRSHARLDWKRGYCSGGCSKAKVFRCPIRDRCPILARAVMNFVYAMKTRIGVSFIALMRIAS